MKSGFSGTGWRWVLMERVVGGLVLDGRDVADGGVQPPVVVPADPSTMGYATWSRVRKVRR